MKRLAALAVGVLLPAAARACAVCGAGDGRNRAAFFWTTILLSLLPLAMLTAGLLYLRRETRRRRQAESGGPETADAAKGGLEPAGSLAAPART